MITKTKIALVAALVLASASTAFAVDVTRNADRDRGFTTYQESAPAQQPRGQAITRPVDRRPQRGRRVQYPVPSDQKHWIERSPIDFNS